MSEQLSPEELKAFLETARSFAKRAIAPLLEHESPDGDLARIPGIVQEGEETGLLASPSPESAGAEFGIWGRASLLQGPLSSLLLLEELAAACGGTALIFHALGLGSLVLAMAENAADPPPSRAVVALMENGYPPSLKVMEDPSSEAPAAIATVAEPRGDAYLLNGHKDFVFQGPGAEAYIVFAREGSEWAVFLVPADAAGLSVEETGFRMGLRACPQVRLKLEGVEAPGSARLRFHFPEKEAAMRWLGLWWLGEAAISAGMVRQAIQRARDYAGERYQGGRLIIEHPAIRNLLADSEARLTAVKAMVEYAARAYESARGLVLAAAKVRLMAMDAACRAVSDCLQVFGGYGYMEDYRMEKLYRDVNSLRSAGGGPRDLRLLIADLTEEE